MLNTVLHNSRDQRRAGLSLMDTSGEVEGVEVVVEVGQARSGACGQHEVVVAGEGHVRGKGGIELVGGPVQCVQSAVDLFVGCRP